MSLGTIKRINDKRINGLIEDCLAITRSAFPEIDESYRWVDFYECGSVSHLFGCCDWPLGENANFRIGLNPLIFNADDLYIKRTILHELAHYVEGIRKIEEGLVWWNDTYHTWRVMRSTLRTKENRSHGTRWRKIADALEEASAIKINRTDDVEEFGDMSQKVNERYKYFIKCTSCGTVYKFERESKFVKTFDRYSKDGSKPAWACPCGAGKHPGDKVPFIRVEGV